MKVIRNGQEIVIAGDYIPLTQKGVADGVATLGGDAKVPSGQLPSYVDDVVEYANVGSFPVTGTSGLIYVALDTNLTYRWTGSVYVEISQSLALGETSESAYRGDRGKTAYDHSQVTTGNPHSVSKSDVGLSNVTNDAQIPLSQKASASGVASLDANSRVVQATGLSINAQTGTTYALTNSDIGKLVTLDNASAITLSVNTGLASDFWCTFMQKGAGQVTVAGTATVNHADNGTKTEKQYVEVTLKHLGSNVFIATGRLVS